MILVKAIVQTLGFRRSAEAGTFHLGRPVLEVIRVDRPVSLAPAGES
jgi:hypothetical protein